MFENDENEGGLGTLGLLGCPISLALVLVMLLLVLVVGGSILAFGFNEQAEEGDHNADVPAIIEGEGETDTEEETVEEVVEDSVDAVESLDETEEAPAVTTEEAATAEVETAEATPAS